MIKDGKTVVLTKEQAIEEHRKMWNWIADQYGKGRKEFVRFLKKEYCFKNRIVLLAGNCFCCDYASKGREKVDCKKCPILWGNETEDNLIFCVESGSAYDSIYEETEFFTNDVDTKKAEQLAREIANLPVKEE